MNYALFGGRLSKRAVKETQIAVWVPLEKNARVNMVTPKQDLVLTVMDNSINHIQVRIEISPGTYCLHKDLSEASVVSKQVCRALVANR
jgi:hypothetical protein